VPSEATRWKIDWDKTKSPHYISRVGGSVDDHHRFDGLTNPHSSN
jgi:hypothetical protein